MKAENITTEKYIMKEISDELNKNLIKRIKKERKKVWDTKNSVDNNSVGFKVSSEPFIPKSTNKTEQTYVEHFLKELKDIGISEDAIIRLYHLDPMVHNNSINFNQLSLEQADTILKEIRR
jgi:hypothetical protein